MTYIIDRGQTRSVCTPRTALYIVSLSTLGTFELQRRHERKCVMASLYNQTMLLYLVVTVALSSVFAEHVLDKDKIDCYPEIGNQTLCEARGCTWEESRSKVMTRYESK